MHPDLRNERDCKLLWTSCKNCSHLKFPASSMEKRLVGEIRAINVDVDFLLQIRTNNIQKQPLPHDHARHLCTFHEGTPEVVAKAIDGALKTKSVWENLPWNDRAAIFLKAADLVSGKYRYELMAATMLGQGKNAWQAEIDAAAEVSPDSPLFIHN